MEEFIEIVEQYRRAQKVADEKERLARTLLAAETLINKVGPRIKAFVSRACRRREVAEDVGQDIFVSIVTNLGKFRGKSGGEVLGWCYTIARRAVADHFRRERVPEQLDPLDSKGLWEVVEASGAAKPFSYADQEYLEYAMSLLGKAKPPCRGYIWSFYIREMDYKEIAKEYGLKYDAVRMKIDRCLKLAITLLAKHP